MQNSAMTAIRDRRLVLIAFASFLPTGVFTTLLGPMLPNLISRWHLNDAKAGSLFLVQFIASLAGVQIAGYSMTRSAFRWPLLFGLLLMAAGGSQLKTSSPQWGTVAIGMYGIGLGLIIPTCNLLIAEVRPKSAAASVSLLNFCWGIGAVLCALGVAWAEAHGFLFVALNVLTIGLILLASFVATSSFPETAEEQVSPRSFKPATPVIWLFAAVFFLYPGTETAVGGWIGTYLARYEPLSSVSPAVMPAFFWAALTVGRGLGGLVLGWWEQKRVLQLGPTFAALGILTVLCIPNIFGIALGSAIAGLSFALIYPVTIARFSKRLGPNARQAGAIMFSLASIGPALLPWTVGLISERFDSLRFGLCLPLATTLILLAIHLKDW
jgi:MFS transporter, FHS family, glucose/mannose:H+ symporter